MILADEGGDGALGRNCSLWLCPAMSSRFRDRLGVGKTALARGLLTALGHDGEVPSPSFAIVQPYDELDPPVWHVDLFRIDESANWTNSAWMRRGGRPPGRMAGKGRR